MTGVQLDWSHALARRAQARGGGELTAILAGSPPGVLSMTGGFPNLATFPTDVLDEIVARLLRSGIRIYEVPVTYRARSREEGKKLTTAEGARVLKTLVRCRIDPAGARRR